MADNVGDSVTAKGDKMAWQIGVIHGKLLLGLRDILFLSAMTTEERAS
jgi:hypothetical protein